MSWITIFSSTPTASSRWSFPSQPFYSPVTKLARELHLAQLGVCASKIVDVEKLREKRIEKILSRIYIYVYLYICVRMYDRVYNRDYFPGEYFQAYIYVYGLP